MRAGRAFAPFALAGFALACLVLSGAKASAQMLDRRWARSVPDLASYAIAPDGSVVAAANTDGLLQSFKADGRVLWRARFPETVRCVLSDGGALCVAYMPSSKRRALVFLDGAGRTIRTETTPGPIRAVSVSRNGQTVAVLAGAGSLTIFRKRGVGWRWLRRSVTGSVSSLAMNASGTWIGLGRRHPSGVSLLSRDLRTVWHWVGREDTDYDVRMDLAGQTLAALAQSGPGRVAAAIVWDARSAAPRWSRPLRGDLPHLSLSPDGRYLAAAYRTALRFRARHAYEWRVMLFSAGGRSLWEVGGLIFGAHLIGVTGPPYLVLTHDGGRVLAALDEVGHMRARHRLASAVQSTTASADGSAFALVSDARVLYLFRARR